MKKIMGGAVAMIAGLILLVVGCSTDGGMNSFTGGGGFKDLEGIPPQDPEQVVLINNVDGFPNIVGMCVEGAGFATTTREAAGAIIRVEQWDATNGGWCAG
jgi:hypothetical protein